MYVYCACCCNSIHLCSSIFHMYVYTFHVNFSCITLYNNHLNLETFIAFNFVLHHPTRCIRHILLFTQPLLLFLINNNLISEREKNGGKKFENNWCSSMHMYIFCQKAYLVRKSSNFLATSLGVLSRSPATSFFLAGSSELNNSHKSPSMTLLK